MSDAIYAALRATQLYLKDGKWTTEECREWTALTGSGAVSGAIVAKLAAAALKKLESKP